MKSKLIAQIQVGVISLVLLYLLGCRNQVGQLDPNYSLPTTSTKMLQDLAEIPIQSIREIGTLSESSVSGNVITLAQIDFADKLGVVYTDGHLRLWNLETMDLFSDQLIGPVSTEATSFSADGLSLITPNNISAVPTESEYETATVIDGINLWDTQTGSQIGCFGFHCQPEREQYNSVTIGAMLRPQGDWLVEYSQTSLYFENIQGKKPDVIFNPQNPDAKKLQHIGQVSFDASGEYYAVAYEEGNVTVYEFESGIGNNNWTKMISLGKTQEIRRPVLSIKIDPTRTWLALLYEDELRIWDLRSTKKDPSVFLAIPSMNTIAFDQSGDLLVVGTKSGLRIIGLQQKSQITQLNNDEVSSVFITTDNRLLVWGDTKGGVHLWGAIVP